MALFKKKKKKERKIFFIVVFLSGPRSSLRNVALNLNVGSFSDGVLFKQLTELLIERLCEI